MRLQDWLALFRRHSTVKIFHVNHLKLLTDMDSHTLRMALRRHTSRNVLQRICRGYYANPFHPPTLEEISTEIYKPSYLSLESALYRHGILSQAPYPLTCVTTRLPREFRTSFGVVQYRQIKKGYFFGFTKENGYFLAEPEKALVDFLYLNRRMDTRGMIREFRLERMRLKRLRAYAKQLGVALP